MWSGGNVRTRKKRLGYVYICVCVVRVLEWSGLGWVMGSDFCPVIIERITRIVLELTRYRVETTPRGGLVFSISLQMNLYRNSILNWAFPKPGV